MSIDNLPAHDFVPALQNEDPDSPDAICMATLETATHDEHGYGFITQCGHARREHPGEVYIEHHSEER